MRLICPNCGAQYEVADDVIPDEGRDVQCSNCGNTWFEGKGASAAAEAGVEAQTDLASALQPLPDMPVVSEASVPEEEPEQSPESDDEPEHETEPDDDSAASEADEEPEDAPEPSDEDADTPDRPYSGTIKDAFGDVTPPDTDDISGTVTSDFDEDEPPLVTTPPRRVVDASIADILREEAARETEARRKESSGGLEMQADLGLPDAPTGRKDPEAPVADAPSTSPEAAGATATAVAATVAAATRRDLLPDIEEINSSLRSSAERGETTIPDPEEVLEEERRGFRFGFFSVLMLIIALTLIYVFAPQISDYVPVLAGVLQSYVDLVDAGRLWLDIKMQGFLDSMQTGEGTAG